MNPAKTARAKEVPDTVNSSQSRIESYFPATYLHFIFNGPKKQYAESTPLNFRVKKLAP